MYIQITWTALYKNTAAIMTLDIHSHDTSRLELTTGPVQQQPKEPDRSAKDLLTHPDLWRAGELRPEANGTPSGFATLDEHLPGNGWPKAGLSELLLPTAGIGELKLLMPLLRRLSQEMRWVAWINAPFMPYAPALEAAGIDISKMLLIHPKDHKEALWALERASRSGSCSITLGWLDDKQLTLKDTRRLQLAARQGNTLCCLFRPEQAAAQASMAELRLKLTPAATKANASQEAENRVRVDVLKRRGGWPVTDLEVAFPGPRRTRELREQLSLWRLWRTQVQGSTSKDPRFVDAPQRPTEATEQRITH